jgi:putative membrane protein
MGSAALAWIVFAGSPAPELAAAQTPQEVAPTISAADKAFLLEAVSGGMTEVSLGELAQQRGFSDAVKQFGLHMAEDYTKISNELRDLATKKGVVIPVPMALLPRHQRLLDTMLKLNGAAFDRQYMREMIKGHELDVVFFQREAEQGRDEELMVWVRQTLPLLQEHLRMAREAAAKVQVF